MYFLNYVKRYLLGELLHLANSRPPLWRSEFYRIKDRLLILHGKWNGVHLQHIVKECFGCAGEGRKMERWYFGDGEWITLKAGRCARCAGTGKYDEFWVTLRSIQLGRRSFHLPIERFYTKSSIPAMVFHNHIEGYVRHVSPKYYLYAEAAYWLALIYDLNFFVQRIGKTGYPSRKFTPMVILSTWLFESRFVINRIRRAISTRHEKYPF